jgi:hypothetical protein
MKEELSAINAPEEAQKTSGLPQKIQKAGNDPLNKAAGLFASVKRMRAAAPLPSPTGRISSFSHFSYSGCALRAASLAARTKGGFDFPKELNTSFTEAGQSAVHSPCRNLSGFARRTCPEGY